MAAQGAWGGGIWGANAGNSDSVVLKEGEEACTICHVRRLEIALLPCKHQFCSECVTCLRKANVFKVCLVQGIPEEQSGCVYHLSYNWVLCRQMQASDALCAAHLQRDSLP